LTIENDVNLAAMAERAMGAAAGATGAFQSLAGAAAVRALAASHGFAAETAGAAVRAAVAAGEAGQPFLTELAARVATGVAAVCVLLDPGLVVLGGEVELAGGTELAGRVAAEVARICPAHPEVVPTRVSSAPVRGAILAAVDRARGELLDSVAAS
jgi:predicted NBD/HSP70 family sugar kinase